MIRSLYLPFLLLITVFAESKIFINEGKICYNDGNSNLFCNENSNHQQSFGQLTIKPVNIESSSSSSSSLIKDDESETITCPTFYTDGNGTDYCFVNSNYANGVCSYSLIQIQNSTDPCQIGICNPSNGKTVYEDNPQYSFIPENKNGIIINAEDGEQVEVNIEFNGTDRYKNIEGHCAIKQYEATCTPNNDEYECVWLNEECRCVKQSNKLNDCKSEINIVEETYTIEDTYTVIIEETYTFRQKVNGICYENKYSLDDFMNIINKYFATYIYELTSCSSNNCNNFYYYIKFSDDKNECYIISFNYIYNNVKQYHYSTDYINFQISELFLKANNGNDFIYENVFNYVKIIFRGVEYNNQDKTTFKDDVYMTCYRNDKFDFCFLYSLDSLLNMINSFFEYKTFTSKLSKDPFRCPILNPKIYSVNTNGIYDVNVLETYSDIEVDDNTNTITAYDTNCRSLDPGFVCEPMSTDDDNYKPEYPCSCRPNNSTDDCPVFIDYDGSPNKCYEPILDDEGNCYYTFKKSYEANGYMYVCNPETGNYDGKSTIKTLYITPGYIKSKNSNTNFKRDKRTFIRSLGSTVKKNTLEGGRYNWEKWEKMEGDAVEVAIKTPNEKELSTDDLVFMYAMRQTESEKQVFQENYPFIQTVPEFETYNEYSEKEVVVTKQVNDTKEDINTVTSEVSHEVELAKKFTEQTRNSIINIIIETNEKLEDTGNINLISNLKNNILTFFNTTLSQINVAEKFLEQKIENVTQQISETKESIVDKFNGTDYTVIIYGDKNRFYETVLDNINTANMIVEDVKIYTSDNLNIIKQNVECANITILNELEKLKDPELSKEYISQKLTEMKDYLLNVSDDALTKLTYINDYVNDNSPEVLNELSSVNDLFETLKGELTQQLSDKLEHSRGELKPEIGELKPDDVQFKRRENIGLLQREIKKPILLQREPMPSDNHDKTLYYVAYNKAGYMDKGTKLLIMNVIPSDDSKVCFNYEYNHYCCDKKLIHYEKDPDGKNIPYVWSEDLFDFSIIGAETAVAVNFVSSSSSILPSKLCERPIVEYDYSYDVVKSLRFHRNFQNEVIAMTMENFAGPEKLIYSEFADIEDQLINQRFDYFNIPNSDFKIEIYFENISFLKFLYNKGKYKRLYTGSLQCRVIESKYISTSKCYYDNNLDIIYAAACYTAPEKPNPDGH